MVMGKEEAYAVECLVNLLYLIRACAAAPAEVLAFLDMTEAPLETLIAATRRSAAAPRAPLLPQDPGSPST